jgi:hypothetical protein
VRPEPRREPPRLELPLVQPHRPGWVAAVAEHRKADLCQLRRVAVQPPHHQPLGHSPSPSFAHAHEQSSGPSLTAGCVVLRLVRYYDRLRRPPGTRPLPGSTPVIGWRFHAVPQCASAGEGLPSSRRHPLSVPRPHTPRSPSRLHLQDLHRFHGLHREPPGSALPRYLTTRQGFANATDRSVAPHQGFRRWASTRPVSRPGRQPATGPPGSYPDRTHTGRRRRACDQA